MCKSTFSSDWNIYDWAPASPNPSRSFNTYELCLWWIYGDCNTGWLTGEATSSIMWSTCANRASFVPNSRWVCFCATACAVSFEIVMADDFLSRTPSLYRKDTSELASGWSCSSFRSRDAAAVPLLRYEWGPSASSSDCCCSALPSAYLLQKFTQSTSHQYGKSEDRMDICHQVCKHNGHERCNAFTRDGKIQKMVVKKSGLRRILRKLYKGRVSKTQSQHTGRNIGFKAHPNAIDAEYIWARKRWGTAIDPPPTMGGIRSR